MTAWTLLIVAALTGVGFLAGLARARSLRLAGGPAFHSLPTYHGLTLAAAAIAASVLGSALAAIVLGSASIFMPAVAAIAGTAAIAALYPRIEAGFQARNLFERIVLVVLAACSAVAISSASLAGSIGWPQR